MNKYIRWLLGLLLAIIFVAAFCAIFVITPFLLYFFSPQLTEGLDLLPQLPWTWQFVVTSFAGVLIAIASFYGLFRLRLIWMIIVPTLLLTAASMIVLFIYLFTPFIDILLVSISLPRFCNFMQSIPNTTDQITHYQAFCREALKF